jgi:hypothetical protein
MANTPTFNMSLLSGSIDDIDDLPGFEVPVPGIYSLKFSTGLKVVAMKGKDTDCVEANFEVIECIEQNDPDEVPTKAGTKFSMLFQLGNEISEGKMKEVLLPIAAHFQERNMAKLITDVCKDLIIAAKVKRRADKEDKEKFYPDVSGVTIA